MGTCRGCGEPLPNRHQAKYCSNACQRAAERSARLDRWLQTGHAPYVGSNGRHYIRLHLLEDQDRRCAICSCPDVWCGTELALVLDHIDGDASNNRRENLRLVCPNCDSQLPTFKSRNRGRGRAWRRRRYAEGKSY